MVQILEAIVDLQFGDTGKGKVVDEIVHKANTQKDGKRCVTVRWQGGTNAGHTIYTREDGALKKIVTHAVPSGVAGNADIAIGPHVAFDPVSFATELLRARNELGYDSRVMISERCGVLFDYHKKLDAWRENERDNKIGTTKSGIGPFYEDNARRDTRITFHDYVSGNFPKKLSEVFAAKKLEFNAAGINQPGYFDDLIEQHNMVRQTLMGCKVNLEDELYSYLTNGDHIIIEGAQGTGLDVDLGSLPDVTSSHLLSPYSFGSLGLPRKAFRVLGIEKIYPTRVGSGVLPTLTDELVSIAHLAGEKGATTGRIRRAGWPDWVFTKRAARINDVDGIYLTRADCVQGHELKVCTGYNVGGQVTEQVPLKLESVEPIYNGEKFMWDLWPGERNFASPEEVDNILKGPRSDYVSNGFESLPRDLKYFIREHDEFVGVPTVGISIGPARGETVIKGF